MQVFALLVVTRALEISASSNTPRYLTVGDQGMLCPAMETRFVGLDLLFVKAMNCVLAGLIFSFQFVK